MNKYKELEKRRFQLSFIINRNRKVNNYLTFNWIDINELETFVELRDLCDQNQDILYDIHFVNTVLDMYIHMRNRETRETFSRVLTGVIRYDPEYVAHIISSTLGL